MGNFNILLSSNFYDRVAPTILTFLISIFLLVISKKERTAQYLAFTFISLTLFNIGYLIGYGIDHPIAAIGWHIACLIVLAVFSKVQFAYYLPDKLNKQEPRIVLVIGILLYLFAQIQYSTKAQEAGNRFIFKNHIYASNYTSQLVPMLTSLFFLWIFVVLIRQVLQHTKEEYNEKSILIRFFARIFFPLSRDGKLVRSFLVLTFFELVINMLVVVGWYSSFISHTAMNFLMSTGLMLVYLSYTVVYVNNSRKNITFMVKIVGVALVFLLVVSSLMGARSISYAEKSYDAENIAIIEGVFSSPSWRENRTYPKSIEYIAYRNNTTGVYSKEYKLAMKKDDNLRDELFQKSDEEELDFNLKALSRKIQNQKLSQEEAKEKAFQKIKETQLKIKSRYYRQIGDSRFIYYVLNEVDSNGEDNIYEFGFSYLNYRKMIHDVVFVEVITILFVVFIVLTIFPLFFRINLVLPLRNLLEGVKEINNGNLKTQVKVDVLDEIGYLTNSFNKMVSSIDSAQEQLEDYAKNLEVKVELRTKELKESLDEVHALKKKQDADYFLSTLLVEPLSHPGFNTPRVNVEYKVIQKKDFEFKNKRHEIGGDYCTTIRVQLVNKDYTVVLNSDAMGKSLQGSGGILVLGSLFQSIIKRTQNSQGMKNLEPEDWLLVVHNELQTVFVSFTGSMMVSIFLGLLEEVSGRFIHINAEHPEAILYRDKKAAFITEEKPDFKVGAEMIDSPPKIRETQLVKGEVVIIGSDGRDDILILDEDNNKVLNYDEKIFVKTVEKSEGKLDRIIDTILQTGELTDDLSVMRLEYNGSFKSVKVVKF